MKGIFSLPSWSSCSKRKHDQWAVTVQYGVIPEDPRPRLGAQGRLCGGRNSENFRLYPKDVGELLKGFQQRSDLSDCCVKKSTQAAEW